MNWEKVIKNIHKELKNYLTENKIQALVLGVSGGIDSALCAALAKPLCDFMNIPLIGRSISILTNKEDEQQRARYVGKVFCTEFEEMDHCDLCYNFANVLDIKIERDLDRFRSGNIKARIRMIILYDAALNHQGLVLSTDNYTEFLLGFWTLHGDVGDYGMIQNLWKTEVYEMARYIVTTTDNEAQKSALLSCIQATPTDGLGITNSDLDQLGVMTYNEADRILKIWLRDQGAIQDFCKQEEKSKFEDFRKEYKNHPIVLRYERTHFKRKNPCNISRDVLLDQK